MADPVTLADFRSGMTAFQDSNVFSDDDVIFYLDIANRTVNADRWKELYAKGVMLQVAHYATLAALARKEMAMGGVGGIRAGAISSETGDMLSVTFDASSVMSDGAGQWNATVYGRQYWQLSQLFGAGPLQSGVPGPCDPIYAGAWPGPVGYGQY